MDDDGIDIGKPVPIRVKVTVAGEEMTIDLTDVSHQVRGFFNSGVTTGFGCTQVAYKCITSPRDYPINDGSFRSLKSIVPPGRIVSAVRPAPMRQWMTFPMTIIDTVFKALTQAIPDRTIAGHHADLISGNIHGINPKNREFFFGGFGPLGGGWGAKRSEDGVSGTVCLNDGDTHNAPCEQVETKIPVVVRSHAIVPDTGGAGRTRGGLGLERVVHVLAPVTFNSQIDRAHCKPWGLEGGLDATGNEIAVKRNGTWKADFPNAKAFLVALKAGDEYRLRSGGGGGYGPPWERPPEKVQEDVRQGYVTADKAAELYGVVIDPASFAIDAAATQRRRAELRAAG
jgi:N-methylhydantoinase B